MERPRICEYKQIDEEIINETYMVEDYDEDGNVIGEHEEHYEKVIPIYGTVYRDMTDEEIEQQNMMAISMPPVEKSLDEKLEEALQDIANLKETISNLTYSLKEIGVNVQEVIKKDDSEMEKGDFLNPIEYTQGMMIVANKFYTDGENVWESIKDGIPTSFEDREYFDII